MVLTKWFSGNSSLLEVYLHCDILQEAMEAMVAFCIMDSLSKEGSKENESVDAESSWDKWKRGGIIGAAAVTGGTIMAITGGMYLLVKINNHIKKRKRKGKARTNG